MNDYDTKILGDGTIGSGKYNNIKIMGNCTSLGDIECLDITVMGDGEFNGEVDARNVKVMGDSTFNNDVKLKELNIYGDTTLNGRGIIESLKVRGDFKGKKDIEVKENAKILGDMSLTEGLIGKNIKILGDVKIKKNLIFDDINILGSMKVLGNCEGNNFYNKGEVKIEGLLSADRIEIIPKRTSRIEEIGGSEIIIKKSGWIDIVDGKVFSKLIEGDTIILQNTVCNIVRGQDITILEGCSIDKIEYTGKLTVDKNSKVGEELCLRN
ncbi:hypothetical protein [uncultured Clostridium sp.]|uniref:hypothetical protein n=1 Tax=uncultured Clostridium sp. TaxID=59620 RepID=UPI002584250E|nr:hypothetical protein [uncultured Clostridium sp.]